MKLSGSPVEVRASGSTIWDQNGKAYLDFAGGYGVFTVGHSHPRVLAAVRAQMDRMSLSGKTMFNPCARARGAPFGRTRSRRSADFLLVQQRNRGHRGRDQTRARRNRPRENRQHGQRISRQDDGRAFGQRARHVSERRFDPCSKGSRTFRTAHRRTRRRVAATRPHSSSSRYKAKAASTYRRTAIYARCARRAIAPARCSSPTKCKPDSAVAAIASHATAKASYPT